MIFGFTLIDPENAIVKLHEAALERLMLEAPEQVEQFKSEILERVAFGIDHALALAKQTKEGVKA